MKHKEYLFLARSSLSNSKNEDIQQQQPEKQNCAIAYRSEVVCN